MIQSESENNIKKNNEFKNVSLLSQQSDSSMTTNISDNEDKSNCIVKSLCKLFSYCCCCR